MKTIAILMMLLVAAHAEAQWYSRDYLNMANTVGPIIDKLAEEKCNYENVQTGEVGKGGTLIYKREKIDPQKHAGMSCIGGVGNVYYIRCYEWGDDKKGRWRKATRDVPLGTFSCIDEGKILIPYADKDTQNAKIGKKFYRRTN